MADGAIPENLSSPLVPRAARAAELAGHVASLAFVALVAPAGYGKTSLLGLACDRIAAPTVRYTVELWHAGEFIEPLVASIRCERHEFGRRTIALASRKPRDVATLDAWSRQLGAIFAAELDHVREPLVVAIDDAHVLADDPVFAGFLSGAVRALPEHVHLVLAGRALPDMPIAAWIAAGRARVYALEDVRFDDDDARALAERLGRSVGEADLTKLLATYEGWAAGIALAFAAGANAVPSSSGTLSARSAYLLDANLSSLGPDLVRFLEETAVFETLDVLLLEREAAFSGSRGLLAELERRGIMLEVLRPGERYRVHPLLREALVERLRRNGSKAVYAAHARAAAIMESSGRNAQALYHFEASEDDAALARFVGTHAYESFIAGRGERIARIVNRLRRTHVDAPVTFALVDGMIARQRGEPGAQAAFARGIAAATAIDPVGVACRMLLVEDRLARREPIEPELFAELAAAAQGGGSLVELNVHVFAGWRDAIAGDFERANTRARRALAIAGDEVVGRTRASSLGAYAATCLGAFAQADTIMATALRDLEASEHVVLFANTLVWYARFALLWKDFAAARDYAERGRSLARELDLPAELAGVELALAEISSRTGDRARCEVACKNAVRESKAAWYAADRERTAALVSIFSARAAFVAGDVAAALDAARLAARTVPMPGAQRAALAANVAAYAVLAGDPQWSRAYDEAREAVRAAEATDALDAAHIADAIVLLSTIAKRSSDAPAIEVGIRVREIFETYVAARIAIDDVDPLVRALRPAVRALVPEAPRNSRLTPREDEILHLIAQGLTNREIAQRFTLSPRTVDTHVERVLSKLGANSRTRAVATAIRMGLVAAS